MAQDLSEVSVTLLSTDSNECNGVAMASLIFGAGSDIRRLRRPFCFCFHRLRSASSKRRSPQDSMRAGPVNFLQNLRRESSSTCMVTNVFLTFKHATKSSTTIFIGDRWSDVICGRSCSDSSDPTHVLPSSEFPIDSIVERLQVASGTSSARNDTMVSLMLGCDSSPPSNRQSPIDSMRAGPVNPLQSLRRESSSALIVTKVFLTFTNFRARGQTLKASLLSAIFIGERRFDERRHSESSDSAGSEEYKSVSITSPSLATCSHIR
mmetsp:Transcript_52794/g.83825  ORF Transcript_52794/g.83825 Transcript_52794/m.83825 type:complete len:265 (+) Transcript_52794:1116-1910(+)